MANRKKGTKDKQSSAKKRKRDTEKYPGLKKNLFSKIKQEYHDIDYADKLNDDEKRMLSDFMEEWLGANLNHGGKKIHRKKQDRKKVYDMNNSRIRDIYSRSRASGQLDMEIPWSKLESEEYYNPEDQYIDLLDGVEKPELVEEHESSSDSDENS